MSRTPSVPQSPVPGPNRATCCPSSSHCCPSGSRCTPRPAPAPTATWW
ncbi:hypothetical protein JHN59_33360 [Streptomyces sp. MBT49]|nr:hypothetical protein [Streptomyces sp. MBT49]